jgi:hypothetical protein
LFSLQEIAEPSMLADSYAPGEVRLLGRTTSDQSVPIRASDKYSVDIFCQEAIFILFSHRVPNK